MATHVLTIHKYTNHIHHHTIKNWNEVFEDEFFYFQMRFTFTGECRHPEQQIHSCQNVGSQFLIANQKFNITYKACQGMDWTANKGMHNL